MMINIYGTTLAKREAGEKGKHPRFPYNCFRIAMLTKRVRPEQADFIFALKFLRLLQNQ